MGEIRQKNRECATFKIQKELENLGN